MPAAPKQPLPTSRDPAAHGVFLEMRMLVGGVVALLGVAMLAVFLWMVPGAASREVHAACAGLKPTQPAADPNMQCAQGDEKCQRSKTLRQLCKPGQTCQFPLEAPNFTAIDNNGKPVHLSDFRGRVVLLNFWASWCGVCEQEKPHLAAMASELAGKDFVVIALASDRSWSDVLVAAIHALAPGAHVPTAPPGREIPMADAIAAYTKALPDGLPFKVFLDKPRGDDNIGPITASWGIAAVPDSALIDRDGNIRAYFVNKREWESPVAETCLRSLIDGRDGTD
jgi:thiol-disulfide isomerase/thioredoxin